MQQVVYCYIQLLQLEHGETRTNLQPALAALRDEIARVAGLDPEDVQNAFELTVQASKAVTL